MKTIRKNTGSKSEENLHQTGTHQGEGVMKRGRGRGRKTESAASAHESPQVDMCREQLGQGQVGNVNLVGSGGVLVANQGNQAYMDLASRTAESLTSSLDLEGAICKAKDEATVGHVSHSSFMYNKENPTKVYPPAVQTISTLNSLMKSQQAIVEESALGNRERDEVEVNEKWEIVGDGIKEKNKEKK